MLDFLYSPSALVPSKKLVPVGTWFINKTHKQEQRSLIVNKEFHLLQTYYLSEDFVLLCLSENHIIDCASYSFLGANGSSEKVSISVNDSHCTLINYLPTCHQRKKDLEMTKSKIPTLVLQLLAQKNANQRNVVRNAKSHVLS